MAALDFRLAAVLRVAAEEFSGGGLKVQYRVQTIKETLAWDRVGGA